MAANFAWFCAKRRSRKSRNTALMTIVVTGLVSGILAAYAHDSWISRGGYRNAAGEWCCGAIDCEAHDDIALKMLKIRADRSKDTMRYVLNPAFWPTFGIDDGAVAAADTAN